MNINMLRKKKNVSGREVVWCVR